MTTRTFQFYGQGWGLETAEITATLNGQTIYSGTIPTVPTRPETGPGVFTPVLLFTGGELDITESGAFPMTITANTGNVIMAKVLSNHVNPADPAEFSMEFWTTDSRTNVTIDGEPQPLPDPMPTEDNGSGWTFYEDQVLAYDLNVLPGVE